MQPADLAHLNLPSDPQISPDGEKVAFVVSQPDLDADRYHRTIWLWDGATVRQFTSGPFDFNPRWSPDGRRLAFLRGGSAPEDRPQVAVMEVAGGEALVLTSLELGFEEVEWSPDGSTLAAVGITYTDDWADLDREERTRRPRLIKDLPFRFDNLGWIHDRKRHIWLLDSNGSTAPTCLTEGGFDERFIAWKPDGSAIGFTTDRSGRRAFEDGSDLFEVDITSGDMARIGERGMWSFVSYRPDGVAHAIGDPDPSAWPALISAWRLDDETDLTGHLDRNIFTMTLGTAPRGPQWAGTSFFSVFEDGGEVGVVRVDADGSVEQIITGEQAVAGVTVAGDGGRLAMVISSTTDPGEVYLWEAGELTCLTSLNAGFREQTRLSVPDHFTIESGPGEVDVWTYFPDGEGPFPVLLNIHGGPASQYGWGFFDEFQVYTGAGYAVVACNPRGSTGRGLDHVRAVVGDGWGVVDVEDVGAALDAALARDSRLDAARLGIMGGSYGGFLTAWMIALQDRFRSAVVERALLSFTSFSGTSDIGGTFPRMYAGVDLIEDPQTLWVKSPLSIAHQIDTPTLIVHSENDFRCPIEQAEQLFAVLQQRGVASEFLRFPGESHELSRSGKPRHRVERFEAILDWHGRRL